MLNIVIPMAGRGSRFVDAGYVDPKPFINVAGRCMIEHVVENLTPYEPHRFIFLARRDHEEYIQRNMSFATNIIYVDEVTEGAACTVLLARDLIDSEDSLLIANSDQLAVWNNMDKVVSSRTVANYSRFIRWTESDNVQDMINRAELCSLDGIIATFHSTHPKWSYAKLGSPDGLYVSEVAEKKAISNNATVGVYWYKRGKDFVQAADQMIEKNIRVNNEFYVCPVFNEMIELKKNIGIYPIHKMYGMGTPEDLKKFEKVCKQNGWCWGE